MRQTQTTTKSISAQLFMTRRRAIDKLQISLRTFRRLCILKGIHPRDPKNKKAASGGASTPKIFYLTKDIRAMASDPILKTLRQRKAFMKKITKAENKKEKVYAEALKTRIPKYSLDHAVKARFPTFIDALRELDDALCMVFLFATTPPADRIGKDVVEECKRLSIEFMHYIIQTRSLRKVFLSIKGIYYQANIQGQDITWLVPYPFAQPVPRMVDLSVMRTFLEFNRVHLGFVNFKLFNDLGMSYPPTVDKSSVMGGDELNCLRFKGLLDDGNVKFVSDNSNAAKKAINPELQERIQSLPSKLKSIEESTSANEDNNMEEDTVANNNSADVELDTFEPAVAQNEDQDNDTVEVLKTLQANANLTKFQSLFAHQNFFLSREVPKYSLEFVIRSFGGKVGWDATVATGSPFKMDSPEVTYIITDRPVVLNRRTDCFYVQPQWVYDCVNQQKLIKEGPYGIGLQLPPHLSPFVVYKEGDYVPEEVFKNGEGKVEDGEAAANDDDEEETKIVEDSESELDEGFGEEEDASDNEDMEGKVVKKTVKKSKKQLNKSAEKKEEKDREEMVQSMMNMKNRNLYKKIKNSDDSKKRKVNRLERKKKAIMEKRATEEKENIIRKKLEKHNIIKGKENKKN